MKELLFVVSLLVVYCVGGAIGFNVGFEKAQSQMVVTNSKAIESTIEVGPGTFARVIVDQQSGRRAIVLPPGYSVVELQVASKDAR